MLCVCSVYCVVNFSMSSMEIKNFLNVSIAHGRSLPLTMFLSAVNVLYPQCCLFSMIYRCWFNVLFPSIDVKDSSSVQNQTAFLISLSSQPASLSQPLSLSWCKQPCLSTEHSLVQVMPKLFVDCRSQTVNPLLPLPVPFKLEEHVDIIYIS